jgi:hypothetical protein
MKHLAVRLSLFLCLLYAAPLFAQTADVSGTVIDQLGAVVPGAKVRLVNQETLVERNLTTNAEGIFRAPFITPGHYQLFAEAQGFSTEAIRNIKVDVGAQINLPIHLKLGRQDATVTVDGSGLTINTTDAAVSTVIDRKFVENIPLNGMSFQDLISMTPGIVTQSPQAGSSIGNSGDFSVNGQRTESNYYMVDGVSANSSGGNNAGLAGAANGGTLPGATALGTTQSLLSVDALQEFRVESSTYSAEYGRSPGGQFSFLTRSGSNVFHGSAFDYLRNTVFDANDWFSDHYGDPIAALRQNDFGGTIGGPILLPHLYNGKDKAFFFASYEGLRLTQPQGASIQYVPDATLRQEAPAALQPILNAFPLPTPNGVDYGNGFAQFIEPYSLPSQINSTIVRVDYKAMPKLALFFRLGDTPSSTANRNLSVENLQQSNSQNYTLGATSQFSSRVANDLRIGYTRADANQNSTQDNFGGAIPVSLQDSIGLSGYQGAYSGIYVDLPGTGTTSLAVFSGKSENRQWNVVDTLTVDLGEHELKAGVDYRRIKSPLIPFSPYIDSEFIGESSILDNAAQYTSVVKYSDATPIFNELAAFVQDEWRVAPSLRVSIGLRWELDPPPSEEHGRDALTALGNINDPSTLTIAPEGTPLWRTTWYNFAPRLGLAWSARRKPGWETVLRTGGGVFFDTANELATHGYDGPGFEAYTTLFGDPLPITPQELDFSVAATPPYSTVYAFPPHLQLPYTLEWNASLEQALTKVQALTISYVGSNGRRLIQEQELLAPSPNFSAIIYVPGGVTSNYQALQVQFQRSILKGFQALASYTWSHSLDYGSTDAELPAIRGNSDFDVRNNLQTGVSWDMPSATGNRAIKLLADHWGLDGRLMARGAFPVTLQGNEILDPATGNLEYGELNLVEGAPLYLHGNEYPGGRAINPGAFTFPPDSGSGDAPRNFVRGFGATQVNVAVRREFHLFEGTSLKFRAESFNILNHPNFGFVDPEFTDITFGQATMMLNQSLGTVASQYQQGGPRSMQFALKLQF